MVIRAGPETKDLLIMCGLGLEVSVREPGILVNRLNLILDYFRTLLNEINQKIQSFCAYRFNKQTRLEPI